MQKMSHTGMRREGRESVCVYVCMCACVCVCVNKAQEQDHRHRGERSDSKEKKVEGGFSHGLAGGGLIG